MKYLIDTHLLLWWLTNHPALSAEALKIIEDPAHTVFVSAVTHWEIWLKTSLGKLQVPPDFAERLADQAFESLPLAAAQTRQVANLPWIHRDPFDRILIAQAQTEGLILLTNDETVGRYGKPVRLV